MVGQIANLFYTGWQGGGGAFKGRMMNAEGRMKSDMRGFRLSITQLFVTTRAHNHVLVGDCSPFSFLYFLLYVSLKYN